MDFSLAVSFGGLGSLFWLVVGLGKVPTGCGLTGILKNLRFKKQEIGREGREYGVSTA
jgi:hypothetical protein